MLSEGSRFENFGRGLALLVAVLVLGTVGFMVLEGYRFVDALYMTVITVGTVGYSEVRPLDTDGKIFDIFLIITGLAVMTYTLGALGQAIIEGSIQKFVGRQRMQREIESLRDHYVVCGHGRMGEILCSGLREEKVPFVVIEGEPENSEALAARGILVVAGDATQDQVLLQAGVKRAKALVAVVSSDVDNLYIVLSARELCRQDNPYLYILSRATDDTAMTKITRAGADRVISPYTIGGMRLVQALLRPTVYDFVDVATQSRGLDLMFEEVRVRAESPLASVALKDSNIRQHFNVVIIAVKKESGGMVFNPGPDYVLQAGDTVITLGDRDQLARLAEAL
jgi:voltage-gated potassium channel